MKHLKFEPIKVTDCDNYKAVYVIKGKVYLVQIDPSNETVDSLTVYPSVDIYEQSTKDNLKI